MGRLTYKERIAFLLKYLELTYDKDRPISSLAIAEGDTRAIALREVASMLGINKPKKDGPVIIDEKDKEVFLVCQTPEHLQTVLNASTEVKAVEYAKDKETLFLHLRGGYVMRLSKTAIDEWYAVCHQETV